MIRIRNMCMAILCFALAIAFLVPRVCIADKNAEANEDGDKKDAVKERKIDPEKLVSFEWAFMHKDGDGAIDVFDFSEKPKVESGDGIQIYLKPVTNAYLYLYMFSSEKELSVIYPRTKDLFGEDYKQGEEILLPGPTKKSWYHMDENKGTERFYLLASKTRLDSLEEVTTKFFKDKSADNKAEVLEEIKSARQKNSKLASSVEKSVPIAGSVVTITRGDPPGEAKQVDAETFFAKTLRLKHE